MIESDHESLAKKIAKSSRFIRVPEIEEGPALSWILTSGFTQKECALIQPTYEWRERRAKERGLREKVRVQAHLLRTELTLRDDTSLSISRAVRRLLEWRRQNQE